MHRVALLAALCVGGCAAQPVAPIAPSPPPVAKAPHSLSAAERQAIEQGVRASLKDPGSAQFGTIMAVKAPNGVVTACGMVNAKNSYGGYTGPKPFLGTVVGSGSNLGFVVASVGGSETSVIAAIQVCQSEGISL